MKRGTGIFLALLGAVALTAGCATSPSTSAPTVSGGASAPGSFEVSSGTGLPAGSEGAHVYHVTYRFTVAPDGSVENPVIVDRDSIPLMVLATRQALLRSTFEPCSDQANVCNRSYTFRYYIPKVEYTAHNP